MNVVLRNNRLTYSSFGCLLCGWTLFLLFINSGVKYSDTVAGKTTAFGILLSPPIALLLAIGAMIFDADRKVAVLSLVLSLVSALLLFSMGA